MPITLPPEDIHLWCVHTDQIQEVDLLAHYYQILSNEEQTRNQRFKFEKDRKQHLITRALVRYVLSEYISSTSPLDWQFTQNKHGKPEIAPKTQPFPLKFNLSHSHKMIVLAVASNQEIGVDIEFINRSLPTHDLAKNTFSVQEYLQLKTLDKNNFHTRFYDIWTLKEAYIKACGTGLSTPLESFSFSFPTKQNIQISFDASRNDQESEWQFWQLEPNPEYIIALGAKSKEVKKKRIIIREVVPFKSYCKSHQPTLRH